MEYQITLEEARTNLLACAAFLAERIKSFDGHAEAMKEIVPRYLAENQVDRAAEFANAVDDPFTRDHLLMLAAEKCAAINDDEYAAQLVEAIEDSGRRLQANERIGAQMAARGAFEKALGIARTLNHPDFVLGEIAVHQSTAGAHEAVAETLALIEYPTSKITALQNIAHRQIEAGEQSEAVRSLDEALKTADEIEMPEEKALYLNNIGNYFIDAGENGKAIETFDRVKTIAETLDGHDRDTYLADAALGFLNAGSLELADRALDGVADNVQIASTLLEYAEHFRLKNEPDEAVEILEEAYAILKLQKDREVRDSRRRFNLWAKIAAEFARLEKNERAIEIAQELPDETAQTGALASIAQICALQNKDDLARQSINAIKEDAARMFALVGVSDQKIKTNQTDEAIDFLREAEALSETVPQHASRSAALNELARRFQTAGDAAKARALLGENLELIAAIRDESSRAVALAQLADFQRQVQYELSDAEREMLETLARRAER